MKPLGSKLPSILKKRASCLRELNQALYSVLPEEYRDHVKVASLHHDILSLEIDSPAWATTVRYRSNDIGSQLSSKTGLTIKSTKIFVQPNTDKVRRVKRKAPTISANSAQQLKSLAKSTPHRALRKALSRLAKHGTN